MADHVYRLFSPTDDIFSTRVWSHPHTLVECSRSYGGDRVWVSGIQNPYQEFPWLPENALSLYGGVRSRTDVFSGSTSPVQVYPIDDVDTHSIDKVIGVPGQYPQTGSINLVWMTDDEQPNQNAVTDTRWYEEHWAAISGTYNWYSQHSKAYRGAALPATCSLVHIPSLFYGRQIATGSVFMWTDAWQTASGSHFASGTRYWVDDGYGRIFDVPAALTSSWLTAWLSGTARQVGNVFYNEGLIVFTNPSSSWHREFWSGSFPSDTDAPSFHLEFDGSTIVQSMVLMCRMAPGEVNASNNTTYSYADAAGKVWAKSSGSNEGHTYITAIGIYNEERQLVGVAKLAQPIRKRERDNIDIRLRLDV